MRYALVAVALLNLASSAFALQPPAPGLRSVGQENKQITAGRQHKSAGEYDDAQQTHGPVPRFLGHEEFTGLRGKSQGQPGGDQPDTDKRGEKGDSETPGDWWSAFGQSLTAERVLAATALMQVLILGFQVFLMRFTVSAARRSADIAEQALIGVERPWLIFEPDGDPVEIIEEPAGGGIWLNDVIADPISMCIEFKAGNCGKSPAWVASEGLGWAYVTRPWPQERPYPEQRPPLRLGCVPVIPGKEIHAGGEVVTLTRDQREALLRDEAAIMVYGLVTYRDVFMRIHETGFCWVYGRPAMAKNWSKERGWEDRTGWNDSEWIILDGPNSYARYT